MTEWLPARIRIEMHQQMSANGYKRSRMQRNARAPTQSYFAYQAATDAMKARTMLFDLIARKLPADYTGELKLY